MKRRCFIYPAIISLVILPFKLFAYQQDIKSDLGEVLTLMGHGSYKQFSTPTGLGLVGLGTATTLAVYNNDQRLLEMESNPEGLERFLGYEFSNAFNFGALSFISYGIAQQQNNTKLGQFALEAFAANNIVLIESWALSYIPIHRRPDESHLSSWETNFRADYSFPSGHASAFATLIFKTWQFYGPFWASFPALGFYWTYRQRVGSHHHYPSDVIATLFLGALASDGTRVAAHESFMDPSYAPIFDHTWSWHIIPMGRGGYFAMVNRAF